MSDLYKDAIEGFGKMVEAVRQDRAQREFTRALAQRNEPTGAPSSSADPGEDLRRWMKEQRDGLARKLGVLK